VDLKDHLEIMSTKAAKASMKRAKKAAALQKKLSKMNKGIPATSGKTARNRRKRQRRAARLAAGPGTRPRLGNTAGSVVCGKGAYFGDLGGKMGSDFGSWGGRMLGNGLDTVFGMGNYKIKRNSLMRNGSIKFGANGPPRVVNTKRGEATIFNHREYIGDMLSGLITVGSSTDYTVQSFAINPGNSVLFPWLSKAASNFQEYEVQGMLVEMITEMGQYATTGALGNVMMAAEYNPLAGAPLNKIQLLELEYSSSTIASNNLIMPVECARNNDSLTHLFISVDENYVGTDARSFNLGTVFCASQGIPTAGLKIAEMWCTYEIALYKPQLNFACPGGGTGSHIIFDAATSAHPFTGATVTPGSTPGFAADGDSIFLPEGRASYLIVISWKTTAGSNVAFVPTFSNGAGYGALTQWASQSVNNFANFALNGDVATTSTGMTWSARVVTLPGSTTPTITFAGGTLISACKGDIWIMQTPNSLVN